MLSTTLAGCGGGYGNALPPFSTAPARERAPNAARSAHSYVPAGVDFGLHRQCVRSVSPSEPNFYYDDTDCPGSSYPASQYWTTGVETETRRGPGSCGVIDQSLPIGNGSPVTESWYGSAQSGYRVEIKTDFSRAANPCHKTSWTWVPLMDNSSGGGPLPRPDLFVMQFQTRFDTVNPNTGATRAFAGLGAQWLSAGRGGVPALVTVDLEVDYYTDPAWGKQPNLPAGVTCYRASAQPGKGSYYVDLDGRFLRPVISLPGGTSGAVVVQWSNVLNALVAAKMLPAPLGGWSAASALSMAGYVGSEVRDDVKGAGGPTADLQIWGLEEFGTV